jgi:phosphatidate cytidylyltransferase
MMGKKWPDLYRRLVVSSITVSIVGWLMVFSDHFIVKTLLVLFVAALAGIGVWEYGQIVKAKKLKPAIFAMVSVAVCVVFAFFSAHKLIVFSQLPAIVLVVGALVFFLLHFKDITDSVEHVAVEFFGVCYVAVPLSFMLAILYPVSSSGMAWDGRWWLVYVIVVTKITDVAAYFIGRLFGKRKLAPFLSPKKTVEGAIAGLVFAVLCSALMSYIGEKIGSPLFHLPMVSALILGFCIGVVGEVGDLAESLFKRDAAIKDSNHLPGLGGVLDMVDSLLFTAPVVYFYLKIQS